MYAAGVSVARDESASYVSWANSTLVSPWWEVWYCVYIGRVGQRLYGFHKVVRFSGWTTPVVLAVKILEIGTVVLPRHLGISLPRAHYYTQCSLLIMEVRRYSFYVTHSLHMHMHNCVILYCIQHNYSITLLYHISCVMLLCATNLRSVQLWALINVPTIYDRNTKYNILLMYDFIDLLKNWPWWV